MLRKISLTNIFIRVSVCVPIQEEEERSTF